jgi:hypothetical protein
MQYGVMKMFENIFLMCVIVFGVGVLAMIGCIVDYFIDNWLHSGKMSTVKCFLLNL